MAGPGGDFGVRQLFFPSERQPHAQPQSAQAQQDKLSEIEGPGLPGPLGHGVHPAVGILFPAGTLEPVPDRLLPDGHVDGDALQPLPCLEIFIAGDKPRRLPGDIDAVPVDVQLCVVFDDGGFSVLIGQIEVVPLKAPVLKLPRGVFRDVLVPDAAVLHDQVEDVFISRPVSVRRLLVLSTRHSFRRVGCRNVRDRVLDRSVCHNNLGVLLPPATCVHRRVVPRVSRGPRGPQGEKFQQIGGDLVPEFLGVLPVSGPVRQCAPPHHQPLRHGPQAPQGQRDAYDEGEEADCRLGRLCPPVRGGLRLPLRLRLHCLPDLSGHKVLRLPAVLRLRAVPFCIQFPTPP